MPNSKLTDKPGAPGALLVSIVCSIIVLGLGEIRESLTLETVGSLRTVLMAFTGLGLALAFFWRRAEESVFLKISAGLYFFGLWVSLLISCAAPLLLAGESAWSHNGVFQQFGFGMILLSGLALIASLIHRQKLSPGLAFSGLGSLALIASSTASFFVKPTNKDELITNAKITRGGHQAASAEHAEEDEGEVIAASGHKDEHEADAHASDAHGDAHGESHEEKAQAHGDEHAPAHDEKPAHGSAPAAHGESHGEAPKAEKSHDAHGAVHEAAPKAHGHASAPAPASKPAHPVAKLADIHGEAPAKAAGKSAHGEPAPSKPKAQEHAKAPIDDREHVPARTPAPAKKKAPKKEAAAAAPHWTYQDPAHWSDLDKGFRTCSVGNAQSPIDIPSNWPVMNDISLSYTLTTLSALDNGHTMQFDVGRQNFARIAGQKYDLDQFHVHTPAEHTLASKRSPMEIHFVHKDSKGRFAVVGVMVEAGARNKLFDEMWSFIPQAVNKPASPKDKRFNIASLIPTKGGFFRYRGSLTTPPCSENVLWSVASEPIQLSQEQIEAVRKRTGNNARPVQKSLAH